MGNVTAKGFLTKITFLASVARLMNYYNRKTEFNDKISLWLVAAKYIILKKVYRGIKAK